MNDDVELLTQLRPVPEPDERVEMRDRARLDAAIPARGGSRRNYRWLAIVAAVTAVLGTAVAVAANRGDGVKVVQLPSADDPTTSVASAPGGVCGSDFPVAMPIPAGYSGPLVGVSPDARSAAKAEQLVRYWQSDNSTIEVRWPVDEFQDLQGQTSEYPPDRPSSGFISASISSEPLATPSGRAAMTMDLYSDALGTGACQSLAINVAHVDGQQARMIASDLHAALSEPGTALGGPVVPLVTARSTAGAAPDVGPCEGPTDTPIVGGPISNLGFFPVADGALQAFLDSRMETVPDVFGIERSHSSLPLGGYTALTLPDASIVFVYLFDTGQYGIVIHAVDTGAGWTIDEWTATGC